MTLAIIGSRHTINSVNGLLNFVICLNFGEWKSKYLFELGSPAVTPAVAVIVVLTVEGMLLFDVVTELLPGLPPSGQGSTGGEVVEATELKIKHKLELDNIFEK